MTDAGAGIPAVASLWIPARTDLFGKISRHAICRVHADEGTRLVRERAAAAVRADQHGGPALHPGADFAFQSENITTKTLHVVLIAVPILLQVYFNSSLTYGLMRIFRVEHAIAAPGAFIGASNFFELAVATAIALFGPESGAALATVVGVLIEVPVMLSVCSVCNRTRHWFPAPAGAH